MYEQNSLYTQTQQLPVESASGTTSPNNSNSGPTAYIVTAICIVFLTVICMSATSCIKDTVTTILPEVVDKVMDELEDEVYYLDDDLNTRVEIDNDFDGDSFEDYFEQVFGEPFDEYFDEVGGRTENNIGDGDEYEFDHLRVLDLDLSIYDNTIDDMVSATAYAGSDSSVRDYVREFVLTDREQAEDLVRQLRAAARNDGNTNGRLQAARDIAESAITEIEAIDLPDANDEVTLHLSEAVDEAVARWEAIDELVELIQENDTLTQSVLESVDEAIYNGTRNAADALENALAASAN